MQPQPKGQERNLVFFFLFTVVAMVGWQVVKAKLYPPPPPQLSRAETRAIGRAFTLPTDAGLADALQIGTRLIADDLAITQLDLGNRKPKPPSPPPVPVAPVVVAPPVKIEPITLGGEGYFIDVTLTPRGAGVQRLALTQFEGADRYGLAIKDANGQPKTLELLPDTGDANFAIYHYATANPDEPRPLDTLGRAVWTVEEKQTGGDRQSVRFATTLPELGVKLTKTFTLSQRDYHLGLTVRVERLTESPAFTPFRYQLAGGRGLPIEGEWFTYTFRNALVGWLDPTGTDWRTLKDSRTLSVAGGSERFDRVGKQIRYVAEAVQYFASAIAVESRDSAGNAIDPEKRGFLEFARATVEDKTDPAKPQLDDITVRAVAAPLDLKPGESAEHNYALYHGPLKVRLLRQLRGPQAVPDDLVDHYENDLHLNTLADYGGYGIWSNLLITITNLMHRLLGLLRTVIPNDGLAIITLTLLVRSLMFPLSRKQAMNMQRMQEQMQKLSPELKKIEEKHKDDYMAKTQAQQELYRRHGVNPAAGLSGCLMVFAQMPIFLGLYYALQESFYFRLHSFLWIQNLTAPDMLVSWGEKIPYISDPAGQGSMLYLGPYLNLLPLIGAGLMFVQQTMTMPPPADEQQEVQQKTMKYMLIVMAIMFYKVPAGLSLYFITSSLWGLTERLLIKRMTAKAKADGSAGVVARPTVNGKPTSGKPMGGKPSRKSEPEKPKGKWAAWWEQILRDASKK